LDLSSSTSTTLLKYWINKPVLMIFLPEEKGGEFEQYAKTLDCNPQCNKIENLIIDDSEGRLAVLLDLEKKFKEN